MSRNLTTRILTRRDHYAGDIAFVIEQRRDDIRTLFQVRRVIPSGGTEELQIEVSIERFGEKRTTQMHSSFVLPPDIADQLAAACATLRQRAPTS